LRKLVWSGPASRDLLRILEYYHQLNAEAAVGIVNAIRSEPLRLLDYPQIGSLTRRRGIRKWSVRGTPFRLLYSSAGDRIVIQRVVHSAMDEA
jgi:plasmid stabilization system protein ParE